MSNQLIFRGMDYIVLFQKLKLCRFLLYCVHKLLMTCTSFLILVEISLNSAVSACLDKCVGFPQSLIFLLRLLFQILNLA